MLHQAGIAKKEMEKMQRLLQREVGEGVDISKVRPAPTAFVEMLLGLSCSCPREARIQKRPSVAKAQGGR